MASLIEVVVGGIVIVAAVFGVIIFSPFLMGVAIYATIVLFIIASIQLTYMIAGRITGNTKTKHGSNVPSDPDVGNDAPQVLSQLTHHWNQFKTTMVSPPVKSPDDISQHPDGNSSKED